MASPTTLVSQFTDSIAFTDPSGAGAWTEVDPIRYDGGLWVEEGTTNLIANPSFETNLTSWTAQPGATISRDATYARDGSYSMRLTLTGASIAHVSSAPFATTVGQVYTATAYARAVVGTHQAYLRAVTIASGTAVLLDDTWQRLSVTFTATGTSSSIIVQTNAAGSASDVIVVDSFQVEHSPYATSYADGSLGDGYAWTGTAHASTSTRAASSVSVDQGGTTRIDPASGSIAFRYKRNIDTAAEEIILTSGVVGAGTDYLELGIDSTDHFYAEWNSNNAGATRVTSTGTLSVDTEYFLYTDWDGTAIRVSIDNGSFDSDTRDAVEGDWSTGDLTIQAT